MAFAVLTATVHAGAIYIAPAGTYGSGATNPAPNGLGSADARVHYPISTQGTVNDSALITVPIEVTFLNGAGSGLFRANYLFTSGEDASAFITIDSLTASTFGPGPTNGFLPVIPFTYGVPLTFTLTLGAAAHGDSSQNSSASFDMAGTVVLLGLVGFDGPTGQNFGLTYTWNARESSFEVPEPAYEGFMILAAGLFIARRRGFTSR